MEKSLVQSQEVLIQSLLTTDKRTSEVLRAIGKVQPAQAINSDLLFNYHERNRFEIKFIQLMQDSEMILGTSTKAIDIIALRFLENWKYEPIMVLLKFIDDLTKGQFKKVHKNVLDLPTLNSFFIEFKGPYIEALELKNRAKDKNNKIEIDYEAYKNRMKNEKSKGYQQAKKFSDYLGRWDKKNILHNTGNIRPISDKQGPSKGVDEGEKDPV